MTYKIHLDQEDLYTNGLYESRREKMLDLVKAYSIRSDISSGEIEEIESEIMDLVSIVSKIER